MEVYTVLSPTTVVAVCLDFEYAVELTKQLDLADIINQHNRDGTLYDPVNNSETREDEIRELVTEVGLNRDQNMILTSEVDLVGQIVYSLEMEDDNESYLFIYGYLFTIRLNPLI